MVNNGVHISKEWETVLLHGDDRYQRDGYHAFLGVTLATLTGIS